MKLHWKTNSMFCLLLIILSLYGCRSIRTAAYGTEYLFQRVTHDTLYHYLTYEEVEITTEPVKYGYRGTLCFEQDSIRYYFYEKGRKKITASYNVASQHVIRFVECMQGIRNKEVYEFFPNGDTASISNVVNGHVKTIIWFMNNQRINQTELN